LLHAVRDNIPQAYGFNQPEALRSFKAAIDADPAAPAPYFGVAYSMGEWMWEGNQLCVARRSQPVKQCVQCYVFKKE
jgi:hypothetical protein